MTNSEFFETRGVLVQEMRGSNRDSSWTSDMKSAHAATRPPSCLVPGRHKWEARHGKFENGAVLSMGISLGLGLRV